MVVLLQCEGVPPLVALANLPLLGIHAAGSLFDKLVWVFVPFLFLLVLGHFVVHLPPDLLGVGLLLVLLVARLLPPPLLLLHVDLLLLLFDLPHLAEMVEVLLESREVLPGLDALGGGDWAAVVEFQGVHLADDVVAAARPVLTGVPGQVDLFYVRQPRQASRGGLQVLGVDEVHRQVQLLQALAAFDVLDRRYVVQGHV